MEEKKEQFPGYPHYPANEDITNKNNGMRPAGTDPGNMGPNGRTTGAEQHGVNEEEEQTPGASSDPANLTQEDLQMLDAAAQNRDMDDPDAEESALDSVDEDGTPLNEATGSYGDVGADLDVPGSEEDDRDEERGSEDEENNYYSLGGDNHENLDEDNNN
jgi:hypothetical protein